ncbi:ubiquinone biosynthesis accessory factor UbiJ [Polynucleobacter sinensis]|jgi:ubiquinone biosynthesis protein UbiJ|uniref:ubiquinone biosynthesis accessory factor UbiJ n=1 Tax=Polynucleobacter sinensis TaxID=1743157 RepID=UPI000780BDC9|nr:hypothetical protein [Polynucleobacter sinensis]
MNAVSPVTHNLAAGVACRGINHVLRTEPWAMAELAKHASKVIAVQLPIALLCFEIKAEGLLGALESCEAPSLQLDISANALSGLGVSSGGVRDQAIKAVKITGDAELAQLLARLAGQLRWEYEEDLARIVGDGPANFAVRQGKKMIFAGKSAANDLVGNLVEYVTEERKVLLNKRDFMTRKSELNELRDTVDRLEKRIQFLEQKG